MPSFSKIDHVDAGALCPAQKISWLANLLEHQSRFGMGAA
jgi:hypothetical protein